MKQIVNKKYFLGLFLLSLFLMVGIVSVTNGQTSIITTPRGFEHIIRLHSLFLRDDSNDTVYIKVNTGENFLSITGGVAIGSNHSVDNNVELSVIGGGKKNSLNSTKSSGIVGGEGNTISSGKNSLIGGGSGNTVENADNSVIGGGESNGITANNSVIAGGKGNSVNGENSVVLGGSGNVANGENSLVLGQGAEGNSGSFAWSAYAKENSARIDTKSGVLIGTYTPKNGVKLVINGALSLTGSDSLSNGGTGGEIRVVNGCIYAFDGNNWQVVGKSSRNNRDCAGEIKACQFGKVLLYQGDTVDAYENYWSGNCQSIKVSCSGGDLVYNSATGIYYPYCYNISN